MPRGGARNRSGPRPDPESGRSDRRGFTLTALPSEGYKGEPPSFPLEPIVLFVEYWEGSGRDRVRAKEEDKPASESFRERESQVWAEAWTTPQACAWSMQPWRWPIVAEYCRLKTVVELDPSASAALVAQLHRYRDQLGLTPAGLKENGWAVATDELADKRASSRRPAAEEPLDDVRGRLTVVSNAAGA
jgi:hypothetical protein